MQSALPDVVAVAQVALEGAISKGLAEASLSRGHLPQVARAPARTRTPGGDAVTHM